MIRCAILLRGVNVGGSNRLAMADFRSALDDLGCRDVQTYLQSGNAVATWTRSPADLAAAVQQALRDVPDLRVEVLVRTADDLDRVVDRNPFSAEDIEPKLLHCVFLSEPVPQLDLHSLLPDRVVPADGVLYVAYAVDAHSSKAARLLSSKRFPVVATARNWRTVLALQQLVSA